MKPEDLNFRHLLYFWAVAKEGSITRAAERLDLSIQTISTQLGTLEQQLGQALFIPQGRSLALTEAGRTALAYADQIFLMGEKLKRDLSQPNTRRPRLAVGVTDAVPKLVAYRLLEGVAREPHKVRLECREGEFDFLLGELAMNRLDLVVADHSAPQRPHLKLHSHLLAKVGISFFACPSLFDRYATNFPLSLQGAPMLLPARGGALRHAIDTWLELHELQPEVVGEFSDSALLKTFGRAGIGLFPAPAWMSEDMAEYFGSRAVGSLDGVTESWYAITVPRRVPNPAVTHILQSGGESLVESRA